MAANKQDVGGVDDTVGRDHHDCVAAGVRWPDLDQPHVLRAHAERELAVKRRGRESELDALEFERPKDAAQELAQMAHLRRLPHRGRQQGGRHLGHLCGRRARGDDPGPVEELVAEGMVAVGVGIDERGNRGASRQDAPVGIQQLPCEA